MIRIIGKPQEHRMAESGNRSVGISWIQDELARGRIDGQIAIIEHGNALTGQSNCCRREHRAIKNMVGQNIGQYRLVGWIQQKGNGAVWQ